MIITLGSAAVKLENCSVKELFSTGTVLPPGNMWQYLEILLVIINESRGSTEI